MKKLLFLLFTGIVEIGLAQTEQAWVFFTSKPNTEERLKTPSDFLTEKAILRKQKYNIVIDSRDLPLENTPVNFVKNQIGITFLAASKWFNGVYVEGDKTAIDQLKDSDIVERIFFMNRSLNTVGANEYTSAKAKILHRDKFENLLNFEYGNTKTQVDQINLNALHNAGFTGKGITIAVMDGGFKNVDIISGFNAARTNNQLLGGYDFENKSANIYAYKGNSHGTSVLSTMAGLVKNQYVGTAPGAKYFLFRTEVAESETPKEEAYWIAAAERADSLGVDIINTSLGYTVFDDSKYNYSINDMDGKTTFISQGTNIALEKGMLPITSAGNSGSGSWRIISAPADSESALSIGAVNASGQKAGFSSFGPTADGTVKPDVVALGQGTAVFSDTGTMVTSNGTSFSGPLIAGAVASLWQALPDKTPQEIMKIVRLSATMAENPDNNLGYGIPDFQKAYENADSLLSIKETEIPTDTKLKIIENPIREQLKIQLPNSNKTLPFEIFDVLGNEVLSGVAQKNRPINVANLASGLYFFKSQGAGAKVLRFAKR